MRTTAFVLLCGLLVACGAAATDPAKSALDEVVELRMSLASLRTQEGASPFAPDLERSVSLLNQAEIALGKGESDQESIDLSIDLVRSQLVLVKSMVARALAVDALERARVDYVDADARIRDLEAVKDDLGSPTGALR